MLAANAVLRSLFGAAFPLFTAQMYTSLGIHWAASIPAFLALACIPFPIVFYKYGAKIRARCKFAAEAARVLEEMRAANGREIDESEAEEEVHQQERMEKLVKSMSRQSRRSVFGGGRRSSVAAPGIENAVPDVETVLSGEASTVETEEFGKDVEKGL